MTPAPGIKLSAVLDYVSSTLMHCLDELISSITLESATTAFGYFEPCVHKNCIYMCKLKPSTDSSQIGTILLHSFFQTMNKQKQWAVYVKASNCN